MEVTGRALVFTEPKKTELRDFTITSMGPEEALIRIEFSGVSIGTERGLFYGDDKRAEFPAVPGYQSVGVVVELPQPRAGIKIGDRVLVGPVGRIPGLNKCWGAHTSHTLANVKDVMACPKKLTARQAVLSWVAAVGRQGVRKAGVKKGDTVVVVGQGMIGQMLGQMSKVSGAAKVVALDRIPLRIETSRRFSSDVCIDASDQNASEAIASEIAEGADVVFEATGRPDMLRVCLGYVKPEGMICNTGWYAGDVSFPFPVAHEKQIRMVFPFGWGDAERDPTVFADTLSLMSKGAVSLEPLITHHIPYRDAPAEYARLVTESPSEVMGMIIDWND